MRTLPSTECGSKSRHSRRRSRHRPSISSKPCRQTTSRQSPAASRTSCTRSAWRENFCVPRDSYQQQNDPQTRTALHHHHSLLQAPASQAAMFLPVFAIVVQATLVSAWQMIVALVATGSVTSSLACVSPTWTCKSAKMTSMSCSGLLETCSAFTLRRTLTPRSRETLLSSHTSAGTRASVRSRLLMALVMTISFCGWNGQHPELSDQQGSAHTGTKESVTTLTTTMGFTPLPLHWSRVLRHCLNKGQFHVPECEGRSCSQMGGRRRHRLYAGCSMCAGR
mmetsp:Transcript_1012/g.1637  ORF Transcript_1012/g.1637 Transcript_1012/m.1637 type:complete len:280 (+) Transcript_1012:318-1157(+)